MLQMTPTRLPEAVQYGMVGVNSEAISTAPVPVGALKYTTYGRGCGAEGWQEYRQVNDSCQGSTCPKGDLFNKKNIGPTNNVATVICCTTSSRKGENQTMIGDA